MKLGEFIFVLTIALVLWILAGCAAPGISAEDARTIGPIAVEKAREVYGPR